MMQIQLKQLKKTEPWTVLLHDQELGSIAKDKEGWKQLSGNMLPEELMHHMGLFIDGQQHLYLPEEIKLRWPALIEEIIVNSDAEYMVICKAFVDFRSFEKMFEEFVPGMIKEEWAINFKVYSHNFDEDFVKQLYRKNEKSNYHPIHKW
ncbi:hypothetical protein [Pedobacter sp. KACC 23697]|uniref:DUF4265 domain-containing protein n=1 Tax=Pedobacter sp. KACC 23697 TaxID=3149230 RepID=A0AAU7K8J2_9SPHI